MSKQTTEKPAGREPAVGRAAHDPAGPQPAAPAAGLMRMQRAMGNAAVQRMLVQRAADTPEGEVSPEVESGIHAARGGGGSLDAGTRGAMESALGADFSGVRVHTDARADSLSRALGARAFTTGRDVFFRGGEFSPATPGGRKLIAHELTHVVQQAATPVQRRLTLGAEGDAYEREAESLSERVAAGGAGAVGLAGGAGLQRAPAVAPAAPAAAPAAAPPAKAAEAAKGDARAEDKKEGEKKKEEAPTPESVAGEVAAAMQGITNLEFKTLWGTVEKQVRSPKARPGRAEAGTAAAYPALWSEELVKKLDAFTAEQRAQAADAAFARLDTFSGVAAAELRKEFESTFSAEVRGYVEGGLAGYAVMRGPILAKFGTLASAKGYYEGLKHVEFPSSRRGQKFLVHDVLKSRLERAAELLRARKLPGSERTLLDAVADEVTLIGGLSIRENRNADGKLVMSDHSFGWAIDVNWTRSPNTKYEDFPRTLQEGLTGDDLYAGPAQQGFAKGGTMDELLPHARTFRAASDTFRAAFESETALRSALKGYLARKGLPLEDAQAGELLALLKADDKKDDKKKAAERRDAVAAWLAERKVVADANAAAYAAHDAALAAARPTAWGPLPPAPLRPGADFWEPQALPPLLPGSRPAPAAPAAPAGARPPLAPPTGEAAAYWSPASWEPPAGPAALPPMLPGVPRAVPVPVPAQPAAPQPKPGARGAADKAPAAPKAPPGPKPEELWKEARAVTDFLFDAWQLFGKAAPGGKKVDPDAKGRAEGIAAHGFVDLSAELIAALSGSDGAGLLWLGSVGQVGTVKKTGKPSWGVKDFMHFELKKADEPQIPFEAPPAKAPAKADAKAEDPAPAPAAAPAAAAPTVQKSPDRSGAPPTLQRAEAPAAATPSPLDVDEEALRGVRGVTAEIGPSRRSKELAGAESELKRRWEQRQKHLREVMEIYKGRPKAALAEADLAKTPKQLEETEDRSIAADFRRQFLVAVGKVKRAEKLVAEAETRWTEYDEVFASREVVDILAKKGFTPADLKAISATESGDLLKTGKNPKGTATGILQITDSTVEDLKGNVKQDKADRNYPARAIPLGARVLVRKAEALEKDLRPMPTGEQLPYFLFASYNAGQGTLQAAQAAARAMSRDPASWAELCRLGEGATEVEKIENSPLGRAINAKLIKKPPPGAEAKVVEKYDHDLKEKYHEISSYPGKVLRRLPQAPAERPVSVEPAR